MDGQILLSHDCPLHEQICTSPVLPRGPWTPDIHQCDENVVRCRLGIPPEHSGGAPRGHPEGVSATDIVAHDLELGPPLPWVGEELIPEVFRVVIEIIPQILSP